MLPELEALGVEAYALDLLGWGFGATGGAVSVEAKRAALLAFQRDVLGGRPAALLGVSLGAAALIDFHAAHPDAVAAALLVDPQVRAAHVVRRSPRHDRECAHEEQPPSIHHAGRSDPRVRGRRPREDRSVAAT